MSKYCLLGTAAGLRKYLAFRTAYMKTDQLQRILGGGNFIAAAAAWNLLQDTVAFHFDLHMQNQMFLVDCEYFTYSIPRAHLLNRFLHKQTISHELLWVYSVYLLFIWMCRRNLAPAGACRYDIYMRCSIKLFVLNLHNRDRSPELALF